MSTCRVEVKSEKMKETIREKIISIKHSDNSYKLPSKEEQYATSKFEIQRDVLEGMPMFIGNVQCKHPYQVIYLDFKKFQGWVRMSELECFREALELDNDEPIAIYETVEEDYRTKCLKPSKKTNHTLGVVPYPDNWLLGGGEGIEFKEFKEFN